MRFKEFINEQATLDTLEKAVAAVRENCKPWLKAAHGEIIYRGILGATETAMFSKHPENRKPKDSHRTPYFNFLFNTGIELVFGNKVVREKALFVTGSSDQAAIYGRLFVVFPSGEFEFISSKLIQDSYEDGSRLLYALVGHLGKDVKPPALKFALMYLALRMSSSQFVEGVDSDVLAKAFGDANVSYEDLKVAILKTFQEFYFHGGHTNIADAIRSKGEIILTKTSGYYSIPVSWFMDEMAKRGIDHHGVDIGNKDVDDFIAGYVNGELK